MSSLRDDRADFDSIDTKIFGINPASPEAHTNYIEKKEFNFPLLSDPDRYVTNMYNALKDNGKSVQRTVYILDRSGMIRFAERGMPSDDKLLETIREF
ncbi:MAG: redoxin domain-containing protein [bacterium]|nr:redoxin domain-containing protein [bacterium]